MPWSIEEVAVAAGDWSLPKDATGGWLKNPIRPEEAKEGEWVELPRPEGYEEAPQSTDEVLSVEANDYLDEWLDD